MLRLPTDLLDPEVVEEYYVDHQLSAWVTDESIVLELTSDHLALAAQVHDDPESLIAAHRVELRKACGLCARKFLRRGLECGPA